MRGLRLHGPRSLQVEDIDTPEPGAGEVAVAVRLTGLCGTDLATYRAGPPPGRAIVIGHEMVGTVARLGDGVDHLRVGELVGAEASWRCGRCAGCTAGELCHSPLSMGRTVDGCAAEQVVVPASAVWPLPEGVSPVAGQALVTAATTARAIAAVPEDTATITIVGAGHAGLLMVQQLAGTRPGLRIVVLGTRPERLELASRCGAHECVNVRDDRERSLHDRRTGNAGIGGVSIDATGSGEGLRLALEATRYGGRIVAYSVYPPSMQVEGLQLLYGRALHVIGTRGGAGHYEEAIKLLRKGHVRPEELAAEPVPLSDGPELLEALDRRAIREPRAILASTGEGR